MKQKITIIGAGNLATHLALVLHEVGYEIIQVYSRTVLSAKMLATKLNTNYTISAKEITKEADLYIIALKDSVVDEVLTEINFNNKLVVHCSGSLPISVLSNYSDNIGVLYPLQTFSKNREIDFSKIPIFIEGNNSRNENILLNFGKSISNKVEVLNSDKRKSLHISAVFACNFVNHMYSVADEFLASKNISFEVLKPLIVETANKVQKLKPKHAQTGPAVRYDENIINDHLNKLEAFPEYQELYKSISKSIFEYHQEKNK